MQQELPHLPQSEINKKISESWRLLSVAERSYYLEKAKLEKEGLDPVSHCFAAEEGGGGGERDTSPLLSLLFLPLSFSVLNVWLLFPF